MRSFLFRASCDLQVLSMEENAGTFSVPIGHLKLSTLNITYDAHPMDTCEVISQLTNT